MLAAWLSWIGTAGTMSAYALLWRGRLSTESKRYATMNFVGGFLAGIACVLYGVWPAAIANFVWSAIGLQSLCRAWGTNRQRTPAARIPLEAEVVAAPR